MRRFARWQGSALLLLCACGSSNAGDTTPGVDANLPVIALSARRWSFVPDTLHLKLGAPVLIELSSTDVLHGFNIPALNVRADATPQAATRVPLTPNQLGTFVFRCDIYCGSGHEEMQGQVIVEP